MIPGRSTEEKQLVSLPDTNSRQSKYRFAKGSKAFVGAFVTIALTLSACSSAMQNLLSVDGLSETEVAQLEELAEDGNCAELLAARDFFEIGVSIGALSTNAPVRYVEGLILRANC